MVTLCWNIKLRACRIVAFFPGRLDSRVCFSQLEKRLTYLRHSQVWNKSLSQYIPLAETWRLFTFQEYIWCL